MPTAMCASVISWAQRCLTLDSHGQAPESYYYRMNRRGQIDLFTKKSKTVISRDLISKYCCDSWNLFQSLQE